MERFRYADAESFRRFQKPGDAITGSPVEAKRPHVLRYQSEFGELSFDTERGIAISPLLPEQQIVLASQRTNKFQLTVPGKILKALMENATRVLSAESLLETLWGEVPEGIDLVQARTNVTAGFTELRKKMGDTKLELIKTMKDGVSISLNPSSL